MVNSTLHILHLPPTTAYIKINTVAEFRFDNLMCELNTQGITDFKIIEGGFMPENTKKIIHIGHKSIIKLAKEQGFENCIIAEDDIKFSSPNSYKYFLSKIPEDYDLFCGLIYAGTVEDNRIMNGASGIMTLYSIHSRFYDFFLSQPDNEHVDRNLGNYCHLYKYYVCSPMVVEQRGGWSYNLKKPMFYGAYLEGKELYIG